MREFERAGWPVVPLADAFILFRAILVSFHDDGC